MLWNVMWFTLSANAAALPALKRKKRLCSLQGVQFHCGHSQTLGVPIKLQILALCLFARHMQRHFSQIPLNHTFHWLKHCFKRSVIRRVVCSQLTIRFTVKQCVSLSNECLSCLQYSMLEKKNTSSVMPWSPMTMFSKCHLLLQDKAVQWSAFVYSTDTSSLEK